MEDMIQAYQGKPFSVALESMIKTTSVHREPSLRMRGLKSPLNYPVSDV